MDLGWKLLERRCHLMLEEREFEGYWWRPSDADNKVPGTLRFSQSEIRPELLGSFEEIKPGPMDTSTIG